MSAQTAREQIAPFADNTSFLEMKLHECLLRLEYVGVHRGFSYSRPAPPTSDPFEQRYLRVRAANILRLQQTATDRVPFKALVARHRLDPVEQDVVLLLFFNAVSPAFREQLEAADLHPFGPAGGASLRLGTLVQALSPEPAIQIRLLARFQPGEPLRRNHLIHLRGPFCGKCGPALETRALLPERVRNTILSA